MYLTWMRLDGAASEVQRALRDPQDMHRMIMRAFPAVMDPLEKARALYSVLYRLEHDPRKGTLQLYVQSRMLPDWSTIEPRALAADGMPNPSVKDVSAVYAQLGAGRMLRFRLRANPTRKIDTKTRADGSHSNGRRVPLHRTDEQLRWLERKGAEFGFELIRAGVVASGAAEWLHSSSTNRTLQGVLYEGHLRVTDGARFQDGLARGLGPGKAYGFGLLSVGPA